MYFVLDLLLYAAKELGLIIKLVQLTPPLFIEVPVPSQESECSCMCVRFILNLFRQSIFFSFFFINYFRLLITTVHSKYNR
jgi:hypothetical protein